MRALVLAGSLLSTVVHAQLPLSRNPGAPPAPAVSSFTSAFEKDRANWSGPFVRLAENPAFFRTFGIGSLGQTTEVKPGSNLIGFEATFAHNRGQVYLTSLQAIYASATGRVPGQVFGAPQGARTQISAREGYAVRSIRCGDGPMLGGLQVIFGRIQPDGTLSATDIYASQSYGTVNRVLDAGGLPFCGVMINSPRVVQGLALLVSSPLVTSLKPELIPIPMNPLAGATPPPALPPGIAPALPPGVTAVEINAPLPPDMGAPATTASALLPEPALAQPAAQPAAQISDERLGELVRTYSDSLVLVEGGQGNGSGFLCRLNGKAVLLTNQHVISGNSQVRFTNLHQATVQVGAARAAAGHDLIAYDLTEALPTIEASADFAQSVSVGDEVVVLGNTEGARVIKPLPGRVVGMGPNLVEISSAFLPGNSGSPIIHLKTGKVIGIATYALVRNVNSLTGNQEPSVRRFGFRLDSVQNWQPVNWAIYQAEAAAVKKVSDLSVAIVQLLLDIRARSFNPTRHTEPRLRTALRNLESLNRNGLTQVDRVRTVQNFLGDIRNVTQRDVEDLKQRLRYDYFQRELMEEGKFRTEIYNGLGQAMQNLR